MVARLAAEQNDVVTTRQLTAHGISDGAVTTRLRRAQLHRVHRGVYAVGTGTLSLRGELTAAALACGAGAVLGFYAAGAWWEMSSWDGRWPEVIVPRGAGRARPGIQAHRSRSLAREDVWRRDGILVTSPARTALDLASLLSARACRRMVRQALAEGRLSIRQLTDVLARCPRHPGGPTLRDVLADGPAPTRSGLEDVVLDLLDAAGIERPEVNPRLRLDGRVIIPDLLWPEPMLAVECDSRRWHSDPLTRRQDADKQAILEAHGHRVLRISEAQAVDEPGQTLARVRAALAGQVASGDRG